MNQEQFLTFINQLDNHENKNKLEQVIKYY